MSAGTAAAITDAPARTAANWAGIFDTVLERDCDVTDIEGKLPEALVGTFYRNGPGRHDFTDSFFDGDGMIRAVRIGADGKVRYRARYIETDKYLEERAKGRQVRRTAGTNLPGGILRNMFRTPAHEANTSVFAFGGGLWALEEGGHPYAIDPDTLATGPLQHYGGALDNRTAFTAHPHIDPTTGDTYAFGTSFGAKQALKTFRVDRSGGFHPIGTIPLPYAGFVHDYALSEKWMVFLIPPMVGNVMRFLFGLDSFFNAIEWRPDLGTKIFLMSRDGEGPIELETDTFMAGHVVGAWDEGDEVVIDTCQLERWSQMGDPAGSNFRDADWAGFGGSSVWRYRIDPVRKTVRKEQVTDMPAEFPTISAERECRGARYAYFAANSRPGEGGLFKGLLKLDLETGASEFFDDGDDRVSLQPTFVPRPGAIDEDDGWIMTLEHDSLTRTSQICIFDARGISDGPVCRLGLGENAGATFHGCWVPA